MKRPTLRVLAPCALVALLGTVLYAQTIYVHPGKVLVQSTTADALDVAGGVQAGTGNVQVIGADGRIPAIDSTRFASLSGVNLTGVARVAAAETIAAVWDFDAPMFFSAPLDRNIVIVTNTGNGIAMRIRGRTDNNLGDVQFTDSTESTLYGSIGITPGAGLTYTAVGLGHTFSGPINDTSVISPTISAGTNDWNPAGLSGASIIRVSLTNAWGLTGMVAQPSGRVVTICNVSAAFTLTAQGENAGSAAANRFAQIANNIDPGECSQAWYDGTSARWRWISLT